MAEKTEKKEKTENVNEPISRGVMKISPEMGKQFMQKVQETYVNKYAEDVMHMIEDRNQLERALKTLNKWIEAVENGNFEYIKVYNKKRNLLAQIENGDLED